MSWKAILFDFNGVIINDESIHQELIDNILLQENLRPSDTEYKQICLGKSDRNSLQEIFKLRGRFLSEEYLNKLIKQKAQAYKQKITQLESLPIYPDVIPLLTKIKERGLLIGVVSGALHLEIELILEKASISQYYQIIVGGDDVNVGKPSPEGYLLAVKLLNEQNPDLNLKSSDCLAIEDSFAGITAAKNAGIQVVGIANTYPIHILQRHANWTVDDLSELELDRIKEVLAYS
jgi:HAD superfamily hydrolase (TIGR01509 family)